MKYDNEMWLMTTWVQSTDALLAFDKNRDGIINNGTELFGNNTILRNGTKAANGFEALKECMRFESKNTRSVA